MVARSYWGGNPDKKPRRLKTEVLSHWCSPENYRTSVLMPWVHCSVSLEVAEFGYQCGYRDTNFQTVGCQMTMLMTVLMIMMQECKANRYCSQCNIPRISVTENGGFPSWSVKQSNMQQI